MTDDFDNIWTTDQEDVYYYYYPPTHPKLIKEIDAKDIIKVNDDE